MNPRRSATVAAAFYPTVVIAGWAAVVSLADIGSPRIENSDATHVVEQLAPSLAANTEAMAAPEVTAAAMPQTMTMSYATSGDADEATGSTNEATGNASEATAAESMEKPVTDTTAAPDQPQPIVVAALTDPAEVLSPEAPPAQAPTAISTADAQPQNAVTTAGRLEIVGECLVAEPCIDQYLFALYERTPKEDTIKEIEKRKVTVKRKRKLVTVTRSFTRLVDNDFTWKDPKAAERVGKSMIDYIIGGMDRSFKLKLFYMLQAAENAGLQPGITSAFRDDYRQSIASGLKAASDRSYHGGSFRGGYGYGLAADIVSVNGATRAKRWVTTEALWKWVDANGKQFGIGRPYLNRDPPHVGPIDGQEYVSRRGGAKAAGSDVKKRDRQAAHAKPSAAKRPVVARS
jgi:D-alanyl-D-alanine carboxypeptidase